MRRSLRLATQYVIVVVAAFVLNFGLPRLAPGDPADYLAPPDSAGVLTEDERRDILSRYELDGSTGEQFGAYVRNLGRGDLGVSIRTGEPVRDVVLDRLGWTLLLVGTAVVLATAIGVTLGFAGGWRRGSKRDIGLLTTVLAVDALPAFFVGLMLLLVFSVELDWFPVYGAISPGELGSWAALRDAATRLVLPVATLTLAGAGSTFLVARSAMVTELQEDYVFMARAKGLTERAVRRHARRNALLPVSTAALLGFSTLISAATVVESIFSYPGLGSLAFDSVVARDYPVLQAVFVLLALIAIAANLLNDLLYPVFDPRVRAAGSAA